MQIALEGLDLKTQRDLLQEALSATRPLAPPHVNRGLEDVAFLHRLAARLGIGPFARYWTSPLDRLSRFMLFVPRLALFAGLVSYFYNFFHSALVALPLPLPFDPTSPPVIVLTLVLACNIARIVARATGKQVRRALSYLVTIFQTSGEESYHALPIAVRWANLEVVDILHLSTELEKEITLLKVSPLASHGSPLTKEHLDALTSMVTEARITAQNVICQLALPLFPDAISTQYDPEHCGNYAQLIAGQIEGLAQLASSHQGVEAFLSANGPATQVAEPLALPLS